MPTRVNIPEVGEVEFPDTMSDAEIEGNSQRLYNNAKTRKAFPNQPDLKDLDRIQENKKKDPRARIGEAAVGRLGDAAKGVWDIATNGANVPFSKEENPAKGITTKLTGLDGWRDAGKAVAAGDYKGGLNAIVKGNGVTQLGSVALDALKSGYSDYGEKYGEGDIAGLAGTGAADLLTGVMTTGGAGKATKFPSQALGLETGAQKAVTKFEQVLKPKAVYQNKPNYDRVMNNTAKNWQGGLEESATHFDEMANAATAPLQDPAILQTRLPFDKVRSAGTLSEGVDNIGRPLEKEFYAEAPSGTRGNLESQRDDVFRKKFAKASEDEITKAKEELANNVNAQTVMSQISGQPPAVNRVLDATDIPDGLIHLRNYPSTATVDDLLKMKRWERKNYINPSGRMVVRDAEQVMSKQVVDGIQETIFEAFPDLKAQGVEAMDWIDSERIVTDAMHRIAKNQKGGIAADMVFSQMNNQGIMQNLKRYLTVRFWKSPEAQLSIAAKRYKLSNGAAGFADTTARLAAIISEVERGAEMEKREGEAKNAKP